MDSIRWEEYGLPALVIAALLYFIYYIINKGTEQHEKIQTLHREERREWKRESDARADRLELVSEKQSERMERAIHELTQAVKEIHNVR